MHALEIRALGLIAGLHERLEAHFDEGAHATTQDYLFAEQIRLRLLGERRLQHPSARAADPLGVGKRERLALWRTALAGRNQARNSAALHELAADEVARSLGRDQ